MMGMPMRLVFLTVAVLMVTAADKPKKTAKTGLLQLRSDVDWQLYINI
jgi:hypothetical protein